MEEYNCCFCRKKLKLSKIAVSNEDGKLFCESEHAPLEENSCALEYVKLNIEDLGKSYFFVRLEEKKS